MPDYLRPEIQAAAKWVREAVASATVGRQPAEHELDTLEFALIRYFRVNAEHSHIEMGAKRHVFGGGVLALVFRRFGRRLRTVGYVGFREGRAFGRTAEGETWERRFEGVAG